MYRYKDEHAKRHWKETQHCYALELETRRVWDYSGDNYVHRLIQSKTDGKLVELNHHCVHSNEGCYSCECGVDPVFSEALQNSKVEAVCLAFPLFPPFISCSFVWSVILLTCLDNWFSLIFKILFMQIVNEYNELLTTQLENQKMVSVFLLVNLLQNWVYLVANL